MNARGFLAPQLAILIGVAAVIAGLTIWVYSERAGRLACEVERVQIRDAYNVLAEKVQQQNAAVSDLQRKAAQAREAGRQAQIAAVALSESRAAEVAALQARIAAPTPVGQDCRDVWQAIRKSLQVAP